MEFYPSGTSRNVVLHHLQVFKRRKLENLHALDPYNTLDLFGNIPKKEYDMHKITAPTALYYGDTDVLTVKEVRNVSAFKQPYTERSFFPGCALFGH